MKAILVVCLAVCAYGQAASTGAKVTAREFTFTSADQGVHRVGLLQASYGMMWNEALLECIGQGFTSLMSIKSAGAQQAVEYAAAVYNLTSWDRSPFIGLHRAKTSQVWAWGDGTDLGNYTNWYNSPMASTVGGVRFWAGEPDFMWGKWLTGNLTTTSSFGLCEG